MEKYKILVIDDHPEIRHSFPLYELKLRDKGFESEFHIVSSIVEFEKLTKEFFDILMVDYNLRNGFFSDGKKSEGTDFIADFRKNNMINKIIFYSTDFKYNSNGLNQETQLEIPKKEYYDLINKYRIDAIVPKDNTEMIVEMIKNCIQNLDPIIKFLRNTRDKFEKNGDSLYYTVGETEYTISQLLEEYQKDTKIGKKFGEELLETVSTLLLDYRY